MLFEIWNPQVIAPIDAMTIINVRVFTDDDSVRNQAIIPITLTTTASKPSKNPMSLVLRIFILPSL